MTYLARSVSGRVRQPGLWLRAALIQNLVPQDAPQSLDAVSPGDLLTFLVRPPGIGDGHFIDAPFALGDFGGDLRLKTEAIGLESDAGQHFARSEERRVGKECRSR